MKFLQLPEFDIVTSALNFDTPDCHVTGGCDLYTTKAAGTDKKLYKNIDRSLESQHAALLKLGASLSPPHRESMASSLNLSRSSPFGPLSEISSRRTFAYLIATLNASHPDYDFSHALRPADFKRERNLKKVMNNIDSTLQSVRPTSSLVDVVSPHSFGSSGAGGGASGGGSGGASTAPAWGAHMWKMVDGAMTLDGCTVFSYQPADDPFDDEGGAIWALHYFFFNKARKRVAYLHVRGVPVMSSHSPRLRPLPGGARRAGGAGELSASLKRQALDRDDWGATKRARYWLGDRALERASSTAEDGEDEDGDDGLLWNRDPDGDLRYADSDDDDYEGYDEEGEEEYADEDESSDEEDGQNAVRGFSEDIAARMELEA